MLFAVTTIRINTLTGKLEETETNQFMLLGDIERHLIKCGCEFSAFEECCDMNKGDSTIIESTITDYKPKNSELSSDVIGTRYIYIHKIN